jgi:hypothetical protein
VKVEHCAEKGTKGTKTTFRPFGHLKAEHQLYYTQYIQPKRVARFFICQRLFDNWLYFPMMKAA